MSEDTEEILAVGGRRGGARNPIDHGKCDIDLHSKDLRQRRVWRRGGSDLPGLLGGEEMSQDSEIMSYMKQIYSLNFYLQGDHSGRTKPPVGFKTKVPLWPGLAWPGQAKAELLVWSQQEVLNKCNCHTVSMQLLLKRNSFYLQLVTFGWGTWNFSFKVNGRFWTSGMVTLYWARK